MGAGNSRWGRRAGAEVRHTGVRGPIGLLERLQREMRYVELRSNTVHHADGQYAFQRQLPHGDRQDGNVGRLPEGAQLAQPVA